MNTKPSDKRNSRRGVLAGTAASIAALLSPRWVASAAATGPPEARRTLIEPAWDEVPTCTPSSTDRAGQGPFFIHEGERSDDISLYRQDIRGRYNAAAEPGTEMQLHLRVLTAGGEACVSAPLRDVDVYVWHCDAQGFYSGFGQPGEQQPDQVYRMRPGPNDLNNSTRFCRGAGTSNANGVVSFRSVFPGWYNGRDIHVHLMVLRRGAPARGRGWYRGGDHLYTTQLYFEPALIDRVHRSAEPYLRRTVHPAYPGLILGDERGSSGLRMKATLDGGVVTAQMQLLIDPEQSRV